MVNDTRVIPARVALRRESGGAVEMLLLSELADRRWSALLRPSRRLRVGERLAFDGAPGIGVTTVSRDDAGEWVVEVGGDEPVLDVLARHGAVPLPPYITTALDDPDRYQTVYARRPASVAAPTAGLHLTPGLLDAVRARGVGVATVELEVGAGTFRPITAERVEDHVMHAERYTVPLPTIEAIEGAARVVAIGTTVVRALESWAATGEVSGSTELFITPGYRFAVVDRLLTNFHVPHSSLLALVAAFVGPRWRSIYEEALAEGYRFLSFGDAMLLDRMHEPGRGDT